MRKKKDVREDYMIQLSREVASPATHYAFTLLDIMTMTDLEVSKQALDIIIELYDVRYQFMKQVPYLQVVNKDGVMDRILWNILSPSKKIFEEESKIKTIRDPERNCFQICMIFREINDQLTEMINDVSITVSRTDASKNKAKGLVIKHMIQADLPRNEKEGQKGYFMNLFNEVLLNFDKMDLKQKIYRNLGFIDQLFRLLEYCAGEYLDYPTNYQKPVSGQHFSNEILFGVDVRPERNAFLRNDIALKCVILLIFSTIKNSENQQYMKHYINSQQNLLFSLFFNTNSSILKYFLTLLIKTYTENLTLLVHIP